MGLLFFLWKPLVDMHIRCMCQLRTYPNIPRVTVVDQFPRATQVSSTQFFLDFFRDPFLIEITDCKSLQRPCKFESPEQNIFPFPGETTVLSMSKKGWEMILAGQTELCRPCHRLFIELTCPQGSI